MNILHLISSGGFYGAERVVVELSSYLKANGDQIEVWVIESPGAGAVISALKSHNVRCDMISVGRMGLLGIALRLRKHIRSNGIDIVHSHGYRTDVLAGLAGILSPVRRIATCHTWYSTTARLVAYEKTDKLVLRLFEHVVVVSPQLLEEVASAGIDPRKSSLVFNGTDINVSYPEQESKLLRKKYNMGQSSKVLLRIGRLDRDKGNSTLLKAFARKFLHQDTFLVFVGEGDEKNQLRELAAGLSLERQIVFADYQKDVGKFLAMSDLFVISSYKEGLPIALLEAMAFGKAIVTTDVGAIGQVIKHKINGWLVEPKQVDSLAQALGEVSADIELAGRIGMEARKTYLDAFTLESMGSSYLKIYKNTIR